MLIYVIALLLPAVTLSDNPAAQQLGKVLFNAIDGNKDGKISQSEAETFFLGFDINSDKEVSYTEFITSLDNLDTSFKGHELPLFNVFDLGRDQGVDKTDIDTVFGLADLNNDGVVSEQEFDTIFSAVIAIVG
ncbi:hypothetical protein BsWGS_07076 [Bradybaena similaris]